MSIFPIEPIKFDTDLFGYSVGRLELSAEHVVVGSNIIAIQEALKEAYAHGTRLVYIYAPVVETANQASYASSKQLAIPGLKVDDKTTYALETTAFDTAKLVQSAYNNANVRIRIEPKSPQNESAVLRELAIASGGWSRFRVDNLIPRSVFEAIFEAWMNNSVNRSIADEVFVAQHRQTGEDVGFITVKRRGSIVNIGLLAVDESCRRQGIARSLLSRAALWALEQGGWDNAANGPSALQMTVVTQGANAAACQCYESFGFSVTSVQEIYHTWLPTHLVEPLARSDKGPLPFCRQHITGKELEYVAQVLATGLDSASRFTVMCAARIQEILGPDSDKVVMVPSGTAALEMACMLADLGAGDEVIMPSYTFSSTANAVVLRGAVPVFVDVRLDTVNIDERLIEAAITERTKAICCVHYAGIPCEMDTICDIAKRHNLIVIEDAAQGFLSTYKGRQLGTIGDFGCFSFHYTKNVICGEGGAISVNRNTEAARRALVLWEKGTNRYDFISGKIDKYEWVDMGSSYVPSEVSCAILWAQLEQSSNITQQRLDSFDGYALRLQKLEERGFLKLPHVPEGCRQNGHIFFAVLNSAAARLGMERELKAAGISAFSHYVPLHSAPAGKKFGRVGTGSEHMAVTSEVFAGLVRFPMWLGLTAADQDRVVELIEKYADSLGK